MSEIGPKLADFATAELRGRGIEIRTGTKLDLVEEDAATLSTGERIPTRTVCWTAGVAPPPLVRELGLPLGPHGRIEVEPTLRVKRHENIWAIGDAAAVPDPAAKGARPTPPTAQHAVRQGRLAADNVASALGHGQARPFRYKTRGVFVDMGRHKAVVSTPIVRFRGFPAWFAARTYHVLMMPGLARRSGSWWTGPSGCSSGARRPSSASSAIPRHSTPMRSAMGSDPSRGLTPEY